MVPRSRANYHLAFFPLALGLAAFFSPASAVPCAPAPFAAFFSPASAVPGASAALVASGPFPPCCPLAACALPSEALPSFASASAAGAGACWRGEE